MAPMANGSVLDQDGNFCIRVHFKVFDQKSPITIQLQEGHYQPSHISRSLFSIEKLVADQGLSTCFGHADHMKQKQVDFTDTLTRSGKCYHF